MTNNKISPISLTALQFIWIIFSTRNVPKTRGKKTWWEETGIQHDCLLHILCPLCQPDQKNCCVETIMVFRRHRTGLLGQLSTVRQQESITGKNGFLQWILYVRPSSTWNVSQTTEQLFTISQRNYYAPYNISKDWTAVLVLILINVTINQNVNICVAP